MLPNADIVHDKFHISAYLNKAVDDVRKAEHRALMKEGDETQKNSQFDWLRNFPDLRCEPTFQSLYNANLETSKAWRLKESFSGFWDYTFLGLHLSGIRGEVLQRLVPASERLQPRTGKEGL